MLKPLPRLVQSFARLCKLRLVMCRFDALTQLIMIAEQLFLLITQFMGISAAGGP